MNNYARIPLIILLFFSTHAFSNKIDSLKTDQDVERFLKQINKDFAKDTNFSIQTTEQLAKNLDCEGIFQKWRMKNWEKVDITNDGLTDLIFIGSWSGYFSAAVVDIGSNNFKFYSFSKNTFENCEFVKPTRIASRNHLKIFRKTNEPDKANNQPFQYKSLLVFDTLTFKFNDFIEFNAHEAKKDEIEAIEINTSYCFGTCPSFNLKLVKSGMAYYEGIGYTKQTGKSTKKLSPDTFNELAALANYINIKSLKNDYAVNWTDDQTATLKITFKDKSTKVIKDYGMQGTFGLSAIYSKMMTLGINWPTLLNYNP
ncbi:DUF6438 domain-containing protein [Pedobacter soli]|uniref:DUF6438 domain-containing protein n=1 Tax=Pedobacter soli TaxID=390242 RepID=A0A1G6MQ60_9SPHI|nr:DUF6438 domain-containing protein [Pedobacter soli]SDC57095.1 hypothetical protein SAMN04488024_102402 [Pedobacter soli]